MVVVALGVDCGQGGGGGGGGLYYFNGGRIKILFFAFTFAFCTKPNIA